MPSLLASVRAAASRLSPHEVLERAEQPVAIALVASSNAGYADMEDFLVPPDTHPGRRIELLKFMHRDGDSGNPERFDLVLYEQGIPCPMHAFTFFRDDPERTITEILKERNDLSLPLARRFEVFRKPVVDRVIQSRAR